jgi:hypothetical protein
MKISQTKRGQALIEATLYKRQTWIPSGLITKNNILLKTGTTKFLDSIITIDFHGNIIRVDGQKQRMRREISRDLIDIVKLKLTRKLKHVR